MALRIRKVIFVNKIALGRDSQLSSVQTTDKPDSPSITFDAGLVRVEREGEHVLVPLANVACMYEATKPKNDPK
jgi:hypothetical protein